MKRFFSLLIIIMLICCSCKAEPKPNQTNNTDIPATENSNTENSIENEQKSKIKKDDNITNEMRERFFDLVVDYRIDAMREFNQGEMPDIDDMKWYIAHLYIDECKNSNGGLSADLFAKEAEEKFGFEYDLDGQTEIPLKAGGLMDFPFAELIKYDEQSTEDGALVTATVAIHRIWPLVDYTVQELHPAEYKIERTAIIEGNNNNVEEIGNIIEFSYTTKDGNTPDKFISVKRYTRPNDDFLAFFE